MISNISPEIAQVYNPAETTSQIDLDCIILSQNGRELMTGCTSNAMIPNNITNTTYAIIILLLRGTETPVRSLKNDAIDSAVGSWGIWNLSRWFIEYSLPDFSELEWESIWKITGTEVIS